MGFLRDVVQPVIRLFAGGRTLAELAAVLGVDKHEMLAVPIRYREFHLRKRSGGYRTIHAPDHELKRLQRRILRRIFGRMRAHPAAMGFERRRSIVDNARRHVGKDVVINMDLQDFFPSTRADYAVGFYRCLGWGRAATDLLTRMTTKDGGLPQGAPTSPKLSNLLCKRLDGRLEAVADRYYAHYTRYADDLTFSLEIDRREDVHRLLSAVEFLVRQHGYRIHKRKKLSIRRRHQRQEVTGLVVNQRPRLPRETRRWLRAVRHRLAGGRNATLTQEQLDGWLAFANMVEREPPIGATDCKI